MLHIITWTEKLLNDDGTNKRAVDRCYKLTSNPYDSGEMKRISARASGGFKIEPVNDDQLTAITKLATDGEYFLTVGKNTFNATFAKMLNLKPVLNSIKVTASDEQRVEFADYPTLDLA